MMVTTNFDEVIGRVTAEVMAAIPPFLKAELATLKKETLEAVRDVLDLPADWFDPSGDEAARFSKISLALQSSGVSEKEAEMIARKSLPHHPRRGRPPVEKRTALRGLLLREDRGMSDPEIVLELRGPCKEQGCEYYCAECDDVWRQKRPLGNLEGRCGACRFRIRPPEQREAVCYRCGDAMRKLRESVDKELKGHRLIGTLCRIKSGGILSLRGSLSDLAF
jgi:hypothetical protein